MNLNSFAPRIPRTFPSEAITKRMLAVASHPFRMQPLAARTLAGSRFKAYKGFEEVMVTLSTQAIGSSLSERVVGEQGIFLPEVILYLEHNLDLNPRYKDDNSDPTLLKDLYSEAYTFHEKKPRWYSSGKLITRVDKLILTEISYRQKSTLSRYKHSPPFYRGPA